MNKRINEMNSILKDLYESAVNNHIKLEEKMVYSYLVRRNVSKGDLSKCINFVFDSIDKANSEQNLFGKWIKEFENIDNIEAFCSENWEYFCQFKNGQVSNLDFVKVYIPLDYDHIYEGVNRIFNFLADSNISHQSKVSSDIRFDDVVVRLTNLEDAKKLQAFINRDNYIQKGLIKPNAFTISNNWVAYAYDGGLSYNSCVAKIIADYINCTIKARNVSIRDINLRTFYDYVDMVSNDFDMIGDLVTGSHYDYDEKIDRTVDAYFVVQLLKTSLTSNNYKDYEAFYNHAINYDIKNNLRNFIINRKGENAVIEEDIRGNSKEELFREFILTTLKKYPLGYDKEHPDISGMDYIYSFLRGNIGAVTRDNNLRQRVSKELNANDVSEIVYHSGVLGEDISSMLDNYIRMVVLNDIIHSMFVRKPNYVVANLEEFMDTNDCCYITSKVGNARNLARTFQGTEMRQFLVQLGLNGIEEYIEKYYKNNISSYERRYL